MPMIKLSPALDATDPIAARLLPPVPDSGEEAARAGEQSSGSGYVAQQAQGERLAVGRNSPPDREHLKLRVRITARFAREQLGQLNAERVSEIPQTKQRGSQLSGLDPGHSLCVDSSTFSHLRLSDAALLPKRG